MMRGGFVQAWHMTWAEIWVRLESSSAAPKDVLMEIYSFLSEDMRSEAIFNDLVRNPPPNARKVKDLAIEVENRMTDAENSPEAAKEEFKLIIDSAINTEQDALYIVDVAYKSCSNSTNHILKRRYHELVSVFIKNHNLIYEIDPSGNIFLSPIGLFTGLWSEIETKALSTPHSQDLFNEFCESLRQFYENQNLANLKSCMAKKCNLLEAIDPNQNGRAMNRQFGNATSWPHNKMKESAKELYGFASDYPGIRHGGTPANARRRLEKYDLAAFCVMMTALSAYLNTDISGERIINGG